MLIVSHHGGKANSNVTDTKLANTTCCVSTVNSCFLGKREQTTKMYVSAIKLQNKPVSVKSEGENGPLIVNLSE